MSKQQSEGGDSELRNEVVSEYVDYLMSLGNEAKAWQEKYDALSMVDQLSHDLINGKMRSHEVDSHRRIVKERKSDGTITEREDTMVVNALGDSKLLIKEEAPADYYGPSEVVSH